ncbi:hypothetical protein SteCoe_38012 [Stentor coeruleus]|uniref:Translin-associated factor X-interacting protein 1 N-terminal domain-containing protein n=1 Tax=Stentor coeruleus TaxID=5963 RepID=A0A1R2AM14_9CILI|nr:hypothetical protein SteCoe_38012 [Stentor coeruleus]
MRVNSIAENRKKIVPIGKEEFMISIASSCLLKPITMNKSSKKTSDVSVSPFAVRKSNSKKVLKNIKLSKKLVSKKNQEELNESEKSPFSSLNKLPSSLSYPKLENISQFLVKEFPKLKASDIQKKLETASSKAKRIEILSEIISEITEDDLLNGAVLKTIKNEYEITIGEMENIIKKQEHNIKLLEQGKSFLSIEIGKHITQNKKLSADYKTLFNKYIKLCNNMLKTSKYDIENIEKSDENWKKIIGQNVKLENTLAAVEDELDFYKDERKKVKGIISILEKKGIPIGELYYKQCATNKFPLNFNDDDEVLDNTDNEDIVSKRTKVIRKHSRIPMLNIEDIKKQSKSSGSEVSSISF